MSSKNSSRSSARSTRRKSKACSFRIRAVLHGGTAFFAFIRHRKFSRQLSRLFPRAVLPALFPACFLGDPLDGLLRNFPAVLWAVFPAIFPGQSSRHSFPLPRLPRFLVTHPAISFRNIFPIFFPGLLSFFYSYPPVFSFRWFIFLSASFPAYPFSIFRPARPLFRNLSRLTLLAPSLAYSATFPAILPVVFSCAASDPPLSFSRYSPSPPRAFPFHAGSMLHLFSSVCDFPSSVHPRFLSSKLPERFSEPLIPITRGAIQTEIKHPGL